MGTWATRKKLEPHWACLGRFESTEEVQPQLEISPKVSLFFSPSTCPPGLPVLILCGLLTPPPSGVSVVICSTERLVRLVQRLRKKTLGVQAGLSPT